MTSLLKHCAAGLIGATMLTACQANGAAPREFDISGQAIDVTTRQPLAGVWIVAKHMRAGGTAFAHSGIWCVKTEGVLTDAQGRFRFTYEKGREPTLLFIKPGYYREYAPQYVDGLPQQFPRPINYKDYDKNYPSPHQRVNVYLRPQDPQAPRFDYGDAQLCDRAASLEDIQPMLTFLAIEMDEFETYGVGKALIDNHRELIELQKQLVAPGPKKK